MKRGDLVTIAAPGDFGKPRPALVIQADYFDLTATVTVLLIMSTRVDAPLMRITVEPSVENGLRNTSQIMVDKVMTVKRNKIGAVFGSLEADKLVEVGRCLAVFMGIA